MNDTVTVDEMNTMIDNFLEESSQSNKWLTTYVGVESVLEKLGANNAANIFQQKRAIYFANNWETTHSPEELIRGARETVQRIYGVDPIAATHLEEKAKNLAEIYTSAPEAVRNFLLSGGHLSRSIIQSQRLPRHRKPSIMERGIQYLAQKRAERLRK